MSVGSVDSRDVDRIRYRMQRVRRHLDENVDEIVANAQQMFNWRYYVRRHPWVSLGAALAAGFLIVPRPKVVTDRRVYLDREAAETLARHNDRLVIEEEEGASPSLFKSMGIMAANALVRAAISYVGQQVGKAGGHVAAEAETPGDLA